MYCSGGSCVAKQCQTDPDCNNQSQFCCQPDSSGNNAACGARWTCQSKGCTSNDSCEISQNCSTSTWECVDTVCVLGGAPCHHDLDCQTAGQTCQGNCCANTLCDPSQKPSCPGGVDPTCKLGDDLTFVWICPSGNGAGGGCGESCGICGTSYPNDGGCSCNDPCGGGCPIGSCTVDSDCVYDGNYCSGGCCQSGGDGGDGGSNNPSCGEVAYCVGGGCANGCDENCQCAEEPEDPLVIDLSGKGFPMTDVQHGVLFDMHADGKKVRTAWTAAHSDVGFLVLDRNGNGIIDNSAELFSNSSPQPGGRVAKNGFKALAVYDQPANGGDRDGWITEKDTVFSKLRIWVDKNHDGVSQPSELLTLKQAGVKAISVQYTDSKWKDAYGNLFRFRGQIVWEKPVNGQAVAAIFDVLLLTQH